MRLFRKYTSNRGSALFMVISTMTAVLMSCMAMYFSVISSRSTQYAVFNQQQSKSMSTSISEAVMAQMMDGKLNDLLTKLCGNDMQPGDKISTDYNTLKTLGIGGDDGRDLGEYTVEITKKSETLFDIAVVSSVNGMTSVHHTTFEIKKPSGGTSAPVKTQMFAATGYIPNDVWLETSLIYADLFFDNELTTINTYDGNGTDIFGDVSAGGSVSVAGILKPRSSTPVTYAIRGNYIFEKTANAGGLSFASTSPNSKVLVGGDLVITGLMGMANVDVYVLGNFYSFAGFTNYTGEVFVDGDVYLARPADAAYIHSNGNVYVVTNDSSYTNINLTSASNSNPANPLEGKWDGTATGYMTIAQMAKELDERTATNTYYKWMIDESKVNGLNKVVNLKFDTPHPIELKYSSSNKGCTIGDITEVGGYENSTTLIIDTGEDEDNVYTIRVQPNLDLDKDGTKETFSWQASESKWFKDPFPNGIPMTVLVKGRGSVVIDVPEGVVYQDANSTRVMHFGWFLLGGGTCVNKTGQTYWNADKGQAEPYNGYVYGMPSSLANNYRKYVHTNCVAGDGCTYTTSDSSTKCDIHTDQKLTVIKCGIHGEVEEYCPQCETKTSYYGSCNYHVDRTEIDKYLNSHEDIKKLMLDSKGKVIYPTTNIFLVSCDESAEFRFTSTKDGQSIGQNMLFGYIYAPYMTFRAPFVGQWRSGQYIRIFGGMTVSDYSIDEPNEIIACWPEKLPTDLMGNDSKNNPLDGFGDKDAWKLDLTGYY